MKRFYGKAIWLSCCLAFLGICRLSAQYIRVQVAPDRADWLYQTGEPVEFTVQVLKNSISLEGVEIGYEISEDMMKPLRIGTEVARNGKAEIQGGTMRKPGFLRCRATVRYEGAEYSASATAGYAPQNIRPTTTEPEDFRLFWQQAMAANARIPMDVRMTLVPERCTEKIDAYHVGIQNYHAGARVYGMLCVPKDGSKKYPALLRVPGAGVRAYRGDAAMAEKGAITFEIGIHGIPVDLPGSVYDNLRAGALFKYYETNLNNRDNYYYKRVIMGCIRAVDFIFSLPQFNGEDLAVYGESQGGALAIMTASLDKRVTGLVAFYPALCDLTGYLHGRAGGWPHMFSNPANRYPEAIETSRYYDAVNFARYVEVPGFYSFGYNDRVCSPTTTFSAYNTIPAPKTLMVVEETTHGTYPEQIRRAMDWIWELFSK